MNNKAYIESGVIESYVLGMTDVQEAAELEQLARQHPDIRQAIDDFEASLEQAALATAVLPDAKVKERLFTALQHEFISESTVSAPAPVIQMQPAAAWMKYVAAASLILLIGSAAMNVYFYGQFRTATSNYQALLIQQNSVIADNQAIQAKALDLYQGILTMSDPKMTRVSMGGVPGKADNLATVFWDSKSKEVYLLPNRLPQTPADKQYQLWAIVNGKPVDAGMIGNCAGLCKMKNISGAVTFAITLEKKGGSPTPNLEELYVLGNVPIS